MNVESINQRIHDFRKRFGEAHLYFAYHAAFPLALTPDLASRIWTNFQRDKDGNLLKSKRGRILQIPWIAIADLLLSNLCKEVAHELYEMDQSIRNELLKRLRQDERFGKQRLLELAKFIDTYFEQQFHSEDLHIRNFANAQRWMTLAYIQPDKVAQNLKEALFSKVKHNDKTGILQVTSLVKSVTEPLLNTDFEPLILYSHGAEQFVRGDIKGTQIQVNKITTDHFFTSPTDIEQEVESKETTEPPLKIMVTGGRKHLTQKVKQFAYQIGWELISRGHTLMSNGSIGIDAKAGEGAFMACLFQNLDPNQKIKVFRPARHPSPRFDFGNLQIVGEHYDERRDFVIQNSDAVIVLSGRERTKAVIQQARTFEKPVVPIGTGKSDEVAVDLWNQMHRRERSGLFFTQISEEDLQKIGSNQSDLDAGARAAVIIAESLVYNRIVSEGIKTIHFAYPNAIPRESRFLGCGRYVAVLGEAPNENYVLVELNLPNVSELHLSAMQLAPESMDSKKLIYERRDVSSQAYRGESRDLAYVLALISRSRPLKFSKDVIGDIWCTGCIDIKGEDRPFLKAVDVTGFSCKLEAFFSKENPDKLFFVPAQNVLPSHEVLFQNNDIQVVSLSQFHSLSEQDISTRKTIVKVQGNELEHLVDALFHLPKTTPGIQPANTISPYRGLSAFREKDAKFFFGREAFTQKLVGTVQNKPIVAVIGASGSGKSSVVCAGLIPQLRHYGNWLIVSFRPGDNPFRALSVAIIPFFYDDTLDQISNVKKLTENLRTGEITLRDVIERILRKDGKTKRFLLFADQFEELYTLGREEDERRRFLDELLQTFMVSKTLKVSLVITMRADFLGKALSYRPFADVLQGSAIVLGPMNRDELRETIERPAKVLEIKIEDGLTDRILDAVSDEPGSLPFLEFALTQLWNKQTNGILTHAAYEAIGGVEQALASYAEGVYTTLTADEQTRARRIFTRLVRPGEETEDTRRVATRADIGEENWELIVRLADARLLVTGRNQLEETIEIVHQALIVGWQRLREWMDADREFRMWQERLRFAMRQWEAFNYDEGALLRGALLAEAEEWLNQRQDDINQAEKHFIETSLKLASRFNWKSWISRFRR